MGYNARLENALTVLAALETVLTSRSFGVPAGAGVEAARSHAHQAASQTSSRA
jgi:aspartate aminotransferase-like enzyme